MNKLLFLRTYFSPFKNIKPRFYFGRVAVGTPVFYPRVVKNGKFKNKKIGFDFCGLYYKTKWTPQDYRFEFAPVWSFVFLGWQVAVVWKASYEPYYWECFLTYHFETDRDKSTEERLSQAQKIMPCVWDAYSEDGGHEKINYWKKILR